MSGTHCYIAFQTGISLDHHCQYKCSTAYLFLLSFRFLIIVHPLKGECKKGGQNRVPEEEPTTVSEYFFNDIFIEVDETE